MAKGNMFQGQARGKVGDVVFSVVHGKQVTRPYVERPHNPRTDKQLMQRAIFANFTRLLYEGRKIFGQTIENVTGEQRTLAKLARYSLRNYRNWAIATFNDVVEGQTFVTGGYPVGVPAEVAEFVAVPCAVVVSRGSLLQNVFNTTSVGDPDILFSLDLSNVYGRSPKSYCEGLKLRKGDTFTFVAQTTNENIVVWHDEETDLRVYRSYFDFLTIRVRDDAFTNETEPFEMTWAHIFEFVGATKATAELLSNVKTIDVLLPAYWTRGERVDSSARFVGFATCIRSRGKLRSTAIMGGAWNFNAMYKSSGIPVNQVPRFWRE